MTDCVVRGQHFRDLLLSLVFSMSVAVPSLSGQGTTPQSAGTPQITGPVLFAVASIKPNNGDRGWRMEFTPDGFTARGVTLRKIVQEAYGVYEEDRMNGGPDWLTSEKFDIEAKIDSADAAGFKDFSLEQRRLMLQKLLADRYKLAVHHETKELPVYALIVAKNGPKFQESKPDTIDEGPIKGMDGHVTRSKRGQLEVNGISMKGLANLLHFSVGQTVVDQTGLKGRYDLSLQWTPDDVAAPMPKTAEGNQPEAAPELSGPSIFTAVQKQLGLKLEPTKSPLDTIVIDHVEHPSEN